MHYASKCISEGKNDQKLIIWHVNYTPPLEVF